MALIWRACRVTPTTINLEWVYKATKAPISSLRKYSSKSSTPSSAYTHFRVPKRPSFNMSSTVTIPQEAFDKFVEVDQYIVETLLPQDPDLDGALERNAASNLDAIDVAPNQGKQLYLLAKMIQARRILEIGTLGGYSAIWMAKALPADGKLISLEINAEHARVARLNVENAGLDKIVEIRVGPAIETLEKMGVDEGTGKFDMVFIDADKKNSETYLKWTVEFSKKGTLIVVDNVVRRGRLVNNDSSDESAVGVRNMFELLKKDNRVDATAVQTVGAKGWDGFALALVLE